MLHVIVVLDQEKSIPVNTSRIIDGGMYSHYECLNKVKNVKTAKSSILGRLVGWIKYG